LKTNTSIFFILALLFVCFSATIYLRPSQSLAENDPEGGSGRLVWQNYNCQSCHQLYGLGGYLGPDLTNVVSAAGKGDAYVLGMVKAGTKQMPAFSLTENEQRKLLAFLHMADASGKADPRRFQPTAWGMIGEK
jgi:nitric oxide reductase subunit C